MDLVLEADRLTESIRPEFDEARRDLIQARLDQRRKDTPAARARVEYCLARMDLLLDLWNESERS
jgi:hypothetical protein